jgi:hypothetical protein
LVSVADPPERISAIFWAELFFSVTISLIGRARVAGAVGSTLGLTASVPRLPLRRATAPGPLQTRVSRRF